jgi:16S rRNA processing protein RimM
MYLIGYVLKPHGIKGEVKVECVSPYPERYKLLNKVYLRNISTQTYSIDNVRISDRFVFLKFQEINSRDEAECIRHSEILINQDDLVKLESNEFFIHDLVGCKVITDQNKYLGDVLDVVQMSSNDIYIIQDKKGKEYLIPAIKDIIKYIDIKTKEIIVHLIDGLID